MLRRLAIVAEVDVVAARYDYQNTRLSALRKPLAQVSYRMPTARPHAP